jgi:hypothetical protein
VSARYVTGIIRGCGLLLPDIAGQDWSVTPVGQHNDLVLAIGTLAGRMKKYDSKAFCGDFDDT